MKDILIVEDQPGERDRLTKLFGEAGYSVQACGSVTEAESALQSSKFRLAILDIGLGDKSGSLLFHDLRRLGRVSFIVIFTGNPSVHFKQRFLAEGAADYIVKGSSQAQSDSFLARVKEILGSSIPNLVDGIALEEFLDYHVDPKSRKLFEDSDGSFPKCKGCGGKSYVVTFRGTPQLPPKVVGKVRCVHCAEELDPDVS